MFRRLSEPSLQTVNVTIDDVPLRYQRGDTVAAALLLAGKVAFGRRDGSGTRRGPYCMMGTCFECLVRIDGIDNVQACLIEVGEGMSIDTGMRAEDP